MANTLKLSLNVQNAWEASETKPDIKHRIEAIALSYSDRESAVYTVTGTSNYSVATFSGRLLINGSDFKHPFTGANLSIEEVNGFVIICERAAEDTAPTGTAAVQLADVCYATTSEDFPLSEDGILFFHNPSPSAVEDGTITLKLTGTTGYRLSVIVWYTPT